jgi:uncharacterized protein (DUF885 family)
MIPTADAELASLAAQYWEAVLDFSPISGTALGERERDDRVDDRSPAAIAGHRARLRGLQDRLGPIDDRELEGEDRITRSALDNQIESDLAELDAGLEQWAVDPLAGPPVVALNIEAFQPVETVEQGRALVARWRGLGRWLDTHGENLRRSLEEGRVAVRAPVEKTIDGLRQTLARSDEELPLLNPARTDHPDWAPAAVVEYRDHLRDAVRSIIRPALTRYLGILESDILPAARADDRPGIVQVPGGAKAYRRLITIHTSLDLDPEEVHRIGHAEVARIDDETRRLGGATLGTDDLAAIHDRLRADPAVHFATRDEVYETAVRSLDRARALIPEWFGILPRTDCVVMRMLEHEEKHSTIAYYREPAVDGSRPGQYYINTSEPETRPRYEAEVLAFHEAIPGHHLQIATAQELTGLPAFRRHLGPTAYFEGWGLYTERLSDEMGLYGGDLDRIGVLSFDAWRACRLVVDTGMHALGWTRQQAIDFMLEHTALAPNNIVNEVDRYIVWPGQALAYKIGQLEILRLRADARERLGSGFEIKSFHDAVLGHGAVSLGTLGEIVSAELAAA